MERVAHHGRTTTYEHADRDGEGAGVLCVHGSGGTGALWAGQLARLSAERPVAAVDLSGHGESDDVDAPPGPAALDAYAADVTAVTRATGARILLGNSLGGAVALHAVLAGDVAPDALVLAGTGAKLTVLPDLLGWLDDDFDRAVEFLHGPDRLFHARDERYAERSAETMRAVGPAVVRRDFRTCDAFDVRDRLDEIAIPALALTGEHDQLTPPRYHEYLADHLPAGRWTTVADAAHLSMVERPAAFNAAVADFLDAAL